MSFERASGILLHITSLPGGYGIGDLGPEAFRFVDSLAGAGQTYWQILPLGPTGYGDSPYQCFSAFAGNTLMISPEKLVTEGLIDQAELEQAPQMPADRVDFGAVYDWKGGLLQRAYDKFRSVVGRNEPEAYIAFKKKSAWWLDDYALYRSAKAEFDSKQWNEWPEDIRFRDSDALTALSERLADRIEAQRFYQYLFFTQWQELKAYANAAGIKMIGDIPIFVAFDSADVWCNQDKFKLNEDGSPSVVGGVPPDFFSSTGQLWGNPVYDWASMESDGFAWWIARLQLSLETVDVLRIDHFRGFIGVWEVPGQDETAANGQWVDVPGEKLFAAVENALGKLPVIVEDLGQMTPEVEKLRDDNGFPGMRILQYGFAGDAKNHDLPHNYVRNCVAYTGTHDNDTAAGWWRTQKRNARRDGQKENDQLRFCRDYLNTTARDISWAMIRAAWASIADLAIAPMQDILGLDNKARMNVPATGNGNWTWRMEKDAFAGEPAERLARLTAVYGRTRAGAGE